MIQYRLVRDMLQLNAHVLAQAERPPISQIPDYVEKFSNEHQYNQDQARYAGSVTPRPFFSHVHYP
jgi:hypothetical protein